jgi:hypothetical protein
MWFILKWLNPQKMNAALKMWLVCPNMNGKNAAAKKMKLTIVDMMFVSCLCTYISQSVFLSILSLFFLAYM